MSGVVFIETLRRNVRSALIWVVLIALMASYTVLIIPNSETLKQYAELLKSMPSFLLNMVGGGDVTFAASPEGFLSVGYYGWIMLVFASYAVVAGINITAAEEDRGIMDVLLSMPLVRWRVIVEKFLAYSLIIVSMVLIAHLALWAAMQTTTLFQIPHSRVLEASLNILPGSLLVLAFTALIATLVRRRSTATAIAAGFVAISYFVDVIGRSAQVANGLRVVSFYSYYDSTGVLQTGLAWVNVIGLLLVAAIMLGGSVFAWQRRDVGL